MLIFLPFFHEKRAFKKYDGFKTVCFGGLGGFDLFITADRHGIFQRPAVSADHLVIQVPCPDAERLAGIEGFPRIGRFEFGEVQQPLLHDGDGICHGFSVFFFHRNRKGLLRPQFIRHPDDRVQYGRGVSHFDGCNAVHPYRQIVGCLCMWLNEGDIRIDIGRHVRRGFEFYRGGFITGVHTEGF